MTSSRLYRARVLIVGESAQQSRLLRAALPPLCAAETAETPSAALHALERAPFDVVVGHVRGHAAAGVELLDALRQRDLGVPFILLTEGEEAVHAIRGGVFESLTIPVDPVAFANSVLRAVAGDLANEDVRAGAEPMLIGSAPAFLETLSSVERAAQSTAPVLLIGETGTGKDVLAARIHARGPRRNRPFVVLNAAAVPASLLDSELFGHVGGAFTGATRQRRGLVMEAEGGTLFLDEIVDLPLELQGRLLRVLENNSMRAVGADHERRADVRFIAAAQRDLFHAVRERRFRQDLYFRLNVLAIRVPPLRDRREDIGALVDYFFQRARVRNPLAPANVISDDARKFLNEASWPGNIRELAAVIERAVVFGERAVVRRDALLTTVPPPDEGGAEGMTLPSQPATLREVTDRHVASVLAFADGDKARAATILGVDVSTLYRWQRRAAPS